jgi:hypothetical protein
MKAQRKRNPVLFDLALFLAFTLASFSAYALTEAGGSVGAVISLALLGGISLILVLSR